MATKKLDYQNVRNELIEIYEKFIKNPEDRAIKERVKAIYSYYANADSVLTEQLKIATNFLSNLLQCGDAGFSKKEVIDSAKDILKELKGFLA